MGNSVPNINLLRGTLDFGAVPNGLHDGVSAWELFFPRWQTLLHRENDISAIDKQIYLIALRTMIDRGAVMLLPRSWVPSDGPVLYIVMDALKTKSKTVGQRTCKRLSRT